MSFTGKATYSSGTALPELAEDVSDIVSILSPHETRLLDALGDPLREATSTHHEWLEDEPGDRKQRVRCANYTQVFAATVEATDSQAVSLSDELDYQKHEKLRGLLRDLENTVINGGQPASNPQGGDTARRTMRGIIPHLSSNVFHTGDTGFPIGTDMDEAKVNYVLRKIWEISSGNVDLIVVGEFQKRKMNEFCARGGNPDEPFDPIATSYESDLGVCRIVVSRWIPTDAALFLDSSRIAVMPLAGRSFHFKPPAGAGDHECGEVIGEYMLELKNEAAHGLITGLSIEENA